MSFAYREGPHYPQSAWVESYGYVEEDETGRSGLAITFRSSKGTLTTCFYPSTHYNIYRTFNSAYSKGGYVNRVLKGRYDYEIISI